MCHISTISNAAHAAQSEAHAMEYAANPVLVRFYDARVPEQWTSKQAKRIYDAAIAAEKDGSWTDHAVAGSIKLDVAPVEPFVSPVGTDEALAERRVRDYIVGQRKALDRMEAELNAFGGQHFTARRETVRAPKHPFDAESFITSIMRRPGIRAIWVHGVKFVRDASNAFVREQKS